MIRWSLCPSLPIRRIFTQQQRGIRNWPSSSRAHVSPFMYSSIPQLHYSTSSTVEQNALINNTNTILLKSIIKKDIRSKIRQLRKLERAAKRKRNQIKSHTERSKHAAVVDNTEKEKMRDRNMKTARKEKLQKELRQKRRLRRQRVAERKRKLREHAKAVRERRKQRLQNKKLKQKDLKMKRALLSSSSSSSSS
eukprot:PhM_4_TR17436/c1_g1_i1/m.25263